MLEWSVFAIAVFFGVFVIAAIVMMAKARASLERIDQTVAMLQSQMDQVNKESLELIRKATTIVDQVGSVTTSVSSKLKAVAPLASIVKLAQFGAGFWSAAKKNKKSKGE
jgi:uncharacterized protein YoxC